MNPKPYLFPYPHVWLHQRVDGCLLKWSSVCNHCIHKDCQNASVSEHPSVCSYGFHYQRISGDLSIASIIIKELPVQSPAQKKRRHVNPEMMISRTDCNSAVVAAGALSLSFQQELEEQKKAIVEEYVKREQFKWDFLDPLRDEILKGLSFVHDYKQINTQISQNINVVIESRYTGATLEDKLSIASEEEKAIYQASKLLEEKLNVARVLLNPGWLSNKAACVPFRFHGAVTKYLKIYDSLIRRKGMRANLTGRSDQNVLANPVAVSIIPHTFIDNAVKYSCKYGRLEIEVNDVDDGIAFSVSSYGPRILPEEEKKIFQPFYRGEVARKQEEEGAGYGLYICELVAREHLGTSACVSQDSRNVSSQGHWTTFSIIIPLRAAILF
jgi:signal transduction histidine kinase